jgi:hypothetical protein
MSGAIASKQRLVAFLTARGVPILNQLNLLHLTIASFLRLKQLSTLCRIFVHYIQLPEAAITINL